MEPKWQPLQTKLEALLAEVDSDLSSPHRRERCDKIIARFIEEGKAASDEPQALMGCVVKVLCDQAIDHNAQVPVTDNWKFEILPLCQNTPTRRVHKVALHPFNEGRALVFCVQDSLEKRYGMEVGGALARAIEHVDNDVTASRQLAQTLREHDIHPFKNLHVAVVGGLEKNLGLEAPIIGEFAEVRNFNPEYGTALNLSDWQSSVGEKRFDYVISGNVLNERHYEEQPEGDKGNVRGGILGFLKRKRPEFEYKAPEFKRKSPEEELSEDINIAGIFFACANILKKSGTAFHVCTINQGSEEYDVLNHSGTLAQTAGLTEEKDISRFLIKLSRRGLYVYRKDSDHIVTPGQAQAWAEQWKAAHDGNQGEGQWVGRGRAASQSDIKI